MIKAVVTGGAGFIGSALCRRLVGSGDYRVLNIDKLTETSSENSLASVAGHQDYTFLQADICDRAVMAEAIAEFQPDVVFHLAAESHVDRSIDGAAPFVMTNLVGTFTLLDACLEEWVSRGRPDGFRFMHISTDEVFGSLGPDGAFTPSSPYQPNSPYAATKAGSDHLVRSWVKTHGFPAIITNCSNNYGPYQFPEKLIPLMILNGLHGKPLPVYGDGQQVRDWLHVDDHVAGLIAAYERGETGGTYLFGGRAERTNMTIVEHICAHLDREKPEHAPHSGLIKHVADRPGHDTRYAIDPSETERALGWSPQHTFEAGIQATIDWYLQNADWWRPIRDKVYAGERLGEGKTS